MKPTPSQSSRPVPTPEDVPVTWRRVGAIALPVVLSNATVPLQGVVDTAIVGNLGSEILLAAVTLGAAMFSFCAGMFNFLYMSTSGLTAQALGAGSARRVIDTLIRAVLIAGFVAAVLFCLQYPLVRLAAVFFEGSAETEALAATYFRIRALGFPAEFVTYALIGWFAGQALTQRLFQMQLLLSVLNIALNLLFVLGFGWGVEGVAAGTVIATWCAAGFGLRHAWKRSRDLAPPESRPDRARQLATLLDRAELLKVMSLNRDIFIRSLLLMFAFIWMARLGSLQGDVVLAANGILILFLHVAAYALDGFSVAAETLVGQAVGARSLPRLRRAVMVSTAAAVALALIFSLSWVLAAEPLIRLFTNVEAVRTAAMTYVPWAAFMPLIGVMAYQMDGIFVGAAEGRGIRNAMIAAAGIFLPLSWSMTEAFGNHGLWAAMAVFMLLRAGFLGLLYPRIEKRI